MIGRRRSASVVAFILAILISSAQPVPSAAAIGSAVSAEKGGAVPRDLYARTDAYLFGYSLGGFADIWDSSQGSGLDDFLLWGADDCSKSPDGFLGFKFDYPCRRHDFGYRNYRLQGRLTEANRKRIDDNFWRDMNTVCSGGRFGPYQLNAAVCHKMGMLYWSVVRAAGWWKKKPYSGYFVLSNEMSDRCAEVLRSAYRTNGASVKLWECNNADSRHGYQNIHINGSVSAGTLGIKVDGERKCLDADVHGIGVNGTRVQLWDCNGQAQQFWIIGKSGPFGREIRNARDLTKCLDADLNTIGANGTKVQLWDCNDSRQQRWRTLWW
ncbi:phospholipase A2 [Sphaerisporangium sp. B11E5]|uniref:phospholipase A2 n=1 Tax=Sphaerisporangium sp. B11E5 TaxID=3153563 RepID=UPI00325E45C7